MHIGRPAGFVALLAVAGCLDKGDYPSLKPRAFEQAGRDASPPPLPSPLAPARAETLARATALLARADAGQRAFTAELVRARPVIARAGPADSEAWITAQEQLSALDASRADTLAALAELDAFNLAGVDAAGLRFNEAEFGAIRAVAERIAATLREQQQTLATLAASLSSP